MPKAVSAKTDEEVVARFLRKRPRDVTGALTGSIVFAANKGPNSWGLTLKDSDHLRLNVGMVLMFDVRGSGPHFVMCLARELPPHRVIERLGGRVERAVDVYKNLPGATHVLLPERRFGKAFAHVIRAHHAAIEVAARFRGYTWKESHSEEAMRALRAVTKKDLPDPLYAKSSRLTFLLTWNPDSEDGDWKGFPASGHEGTWRCRNKSAMPGDRLFWLRQGGKPWSRGLFASGVVTSRGWSDGRVSYKVDRVAYPAEPGRVLPLARLQATARHLHWGSETSGIVIAPDDADAIDKLWVAFSEGASELEEMPDESEGAVEGELRYRMASHRARERTLRDKKIRAVMARKGSLRCEVPGCGFDFEQAYGDLGRGFAFVHHLVALGSRKAPRRTSLNQLAVVCANCHAMIHLGGHNRPLGSLRRASHGRRRGSTL